MKKLTDEIIEYNKNDLFENIHMLIEQYGKTNKKINSYTNYSSSIFAASLKSDLASYIINIYLDEYIVNVYNRKANNENDFKKYLEIKSLFEKEVGKLEPKKYEIEIEYNKFITIDINAFLILKNASLIPSEEIKDLSRENKIFISNMFMNNKISVIKQSFNSLDENIEKEIEKHTNNLVHIIALEKENIKLYKNINEKEFIDLFFKSIFINLIPYYVTAANFKKMKLDEKLITKKIFKEKEKRKTNEWFVDLMKYYSPELWIQFGMKGKIFSPFKFFGLKLEQAAGNNIPIVYNKNIKTPHPNHGGFKSIQEELKKEFLYIKESLKNKQVERKELIDWYKFLIKSNLIDLFEITSLLFPLKKEEIEEQEIKYLMNVIIRNNDYNWNQLYFKINLEKNLQEELINNPKKLKI